MFREIRHPSGPKEIHIQQFGTLGPKTPHNIIGVSWCIDLKCCLAATIYLILKPQELEKRKGGTKQPSATMRNLNLCCRANLQHARRSKQGTFCWECRCRLLEFVCSTFPASTKVPVSFIWLQLVVSRKDFVHWFKKQDAYASFAISRKKSSVPNTIDWRVILRKILNSSYGYIFNGLFA